VPETVRIGSAGPAAEGEDDGVTRRVSSPEAKLRARRCPTCRQIFSGDARFCPFDGDPLVDAPEWNPTADPLIGKTVDGRYEVTRVLGEGGMGTIYEVRHTTLGRRFALKVLRRDIADKELNLRFIQEAKAAAAIGHPNIVAVNDFGSIEIEGGGSVPYFVMEHLEGEGLAEVLRRETTIEPRRAAGIVEQCVSGLAAAHAAGVIHRDLKPDNVFLTHVGEREFVKLLDFGVAKMAGAGRLTQAGTVFGTPHYMSPEQAAGHPIDNRADIYALGIILYECLSGRVPFEADSYMGVLTKHMFAVPEPIEHAVGSASSLGGLAPIVMRCLAKEPADRYATMEELGAALELFLRDPSSAAASGLTPRQRVAELKLREPEAMEGRVSLPPPPVTRIWPTVVVVMALTAAGIAAYQWVAAPAGREPISPAPSATSVPTTAPAAAAPTLPTPEPAPSASAAAGLESASSAPPAARRPAPARRPAASRPDKGSGDVVDPWAK
jgi:eukaryotic-like serine/threonine-protein kinase